MKERSEEELEDLLEMPGVAQWDGVTRLASLSDEAAQARVRLADCAKRYDWDGVFGCSPRSRGS
jgi:hypothetical protein